MDAAAELGKNPVSKGRFKRSEFLFQNVRISGYVNTESIWSLFKKNLNASKPSEHPPQVEECLKV